MIPDKINISPFLTLYSAKTDKFKCEQLTLSLVTPIDKIESPVSLLAFSVLKRGTAKYPSQGLLNKRLDDLYATTLSIRCKRFGNSNFLGFTAEMLGKDYTDSNEKEDIFDGVLDVICQMMFCPLTDGKGHFLSNYVESEKNNQCDAIRAKINNPREYAMQRCYEIMYGDDPYGMNLLGDVDTVRSISDFSLFSQYRKLIEENRFEVFYIGSRDSYEIEEKIRALVLPYIHPGNITKIPETEVSDKVDQIKRVDEEMPLAQGKLVIGFRTGIHVCHKDFYAMLVANEIFGGSPLSKLFMNVREKMSLCYYCSSSYDIYKGSVFVSCGVSPRNRTIAEDEIFRQLKELRSGNVTTVEFEAAKKSLLNSYRSISDSPAVLETYYLGREEFGVRCSVEECMEKIAAVTLEDAVRVASLIKTDTVYFLNGNGEEDDEQSD